MDDDEYRVICLPGREIPNWFSHKGIGSSISFRAPSISNGQFLRLLVSVVYAFDQAKVWIADEIPYLVIKNKTRGYKDFHWPLKSGAHDRICGEYSPLYRKEDHFFLCLTPLIRHKYELENGVIFYELVMESGDEIEVTIKFWGLKVTVKKCGVHLLVAEPNVK
jgi:hypothetical protein